MENICTTDLQQPPRQVDGHHVVDAAGEEAGGGEVLQHDPAEQTVSYIVTIYDKVIPPDKQLSKS